MYKFVKVLIIGSGPAGYTAAIYASRAMLFPVLICGPKPGGQLISTTEIDNFPGNINPIQGYELMQNIHKQAIRVGAKIIMDTVTKVDLNNIPFHIKMISGMIYVTNSLIIATGSEPKMLNLPEEKLLIGNNISTCATCDGFFYKNKIVAIIGGGNTAITEAIYLSKIVKKIIIINRNYNFNSDKILIEKLSELKNIKFIHDSIVTKYITKNKKNKQILIGLEIKTDGIINKIEIDGIFIAIGTKPYLGPFDGLINQNKQGYICTNIKQNNFTATNIEGIFAAGDVTEICYKQAIVAAGFGCMAAIDAEHFLLN